jgi:antirestriction protein ArdC
VAYRASWAKVIKDDPKLLVTAASQATKAADHVPGPTRELQKTATVAEPERVIEDREMELV